MKSIKKSILVMALFFAFTACEETDFDDPTFYTLEEAVENTPDYALKLTTGAVQLAMFEMTDFEGVHLAAMADQISSTNRFTEFWDWAQEPRKTINNSVSYGAYSVMNSFYANFYDANLNANIVIDLTEAKGIPALDAQGNDRTDDVLPAIYFVKGIAQGYLGLLYDRGIVVNDLTTTTVDFPDSYKDLIASSMTAFDKAIQLANSNTNLDFDFMGATIPVTRDQFIKMCNSFAARILASVPRSKAEAVALGASHWDKVIGYANSGFTADFTLPADPNIWWHNTLNWGLFLLSDGAGYLPVDIKVAHLLDNSQPKYYPPAPTILAELTTSDARYSQYFGYDPDFGFLRADRNRGLFTNYYRKRWDNESNDNSVLGTPCPVVIKDEMMLLKAEAALFKGDATTAANLLNGAGTSRKLAGLADVAANESAVRAALHYEYAVEMDIANGVGGVWAFMRRNDLLIGGTPTQLPLPQQPLQLVGIDTYTFGGVANFGATGKYGEIATAANNGWKASE